MGSCRLVLANDHTLFRQGLRHMLETQSHIEVVGEAGDGLELLELLNNRPADMVLLDLSMPNLRGIDAIFEVKKTSQSEDTGFNHVQ